MSDTALRLIVIFGLSFIFAALGAPRWAALVCAVVTNYVLDRSFG
ncbi:MAG: hypothetical protein WAM90_12720 [Rhodanobacter sp.]